MFNYLLPLIAVLIWSGNTLVNKLAVGALEPSEISFLRWLVAGILFSPFMLPVLYRYRASVLKHLKSLIIFGLLGMVIYQSLAYVAAHHTSATNMGLALALSPLLTQLCAVIILGERLSLAAVLGATISLTGISLVLSHGQPLTLITQGLNFGDALMFIATLAYAIYSVLLRKWPLPIPKVLALYVQILVAIVALAPLYFFSAKQGVTLHSLPLILYAGIPASMIAPLLWMVAVGKLGASRTASFMNLYPIFTAALAALFLAESLHWYHFVGATLVLGGVFLATRSPTSTATTNT